MRRATYQIRDVLRSLLTYTVHVRLTCASTPARVCRKSQTLFLYSEISSEHKFYHLLVVLPNFSGFLFAVHVRNFFGCQDKDAHRYDVAFVATETTFH